MREVQWTPQRRVSMGSRTGPNAGWVACSLLGNINEEGRSYSKRMQKYLQSWEMAKRRRNVFLRDFFFVQNVITILDLYWMICISIWMGRWMFVKLIIREYLSPIYLKKSLAHRSCDIPKLNVFWQRIQGWFKLKWIITCWEQCREMSFLDWGKAG